ncbi:McrC family protein [Kaistella antarctica]|uniref:5-methylcytosine restriction system protein n=1 Tax=Kaistella antarctica TaxID=266748 RepID=A0A448NUU2_9FLAO|nr:5-methylcytosine restriction system protein [Kaistella antarctica]KEY20328.1 5-methylcytosine restriction system protein [Kaistella antarctica]SEV90925.1 5-methylcytosine-specific restriction enzyme subunit McrC [Kaistella antarctica]VEI01545.1 5-methylcytosine-specific restriction enzyme subunit McrC [Kaistella antarctica]
MNSKNFIQVFEYQKLKIGDGDFSENHFKSLVKFNEKNGNKYFTPVYNGILFNSYVGVIQVGGLTIEILPKADNSSDPSKKLWQNVLINMLRVCRYIKVDTVSETGLKKKHNSILEVYFEIFLNDLEQLVKKGLIKKYRRVENNQLALKGKLVFSRDIEKNIVHKERFYCEHQVYDKDHLIHQILFQALTILDNLVTQKLQDKVKRLLFEFNNFTYKEFNSKHFENLKLDRKSRPYEKSLDIAKMLILNYSPNLNSGSDQMLTLLFDMNKLWEEYIYRVLQKHNVDNQFEISSQDRDLFWENKTIRPDIVIKELKTDETFIIDTKWKIVDNSNPSDDDLKQMFTYNLHWKSSKSILLYPKIDQQDSQFGKYYHNPIFEFENEFKPIQNFCKVGFISIIDGENYRDTKSLSSEIIGKLYV